MVGECVSVRGTKGIGFTSMEAKVVHVSPITFILRKGYFNPFIPANRIDWESNVACSYTLRVFQVSGRPVVTPPMGIWLRGIMKSNLARMVL